MITHVNSVFVANTVGKTADKNTFAAKTVFLEKENLNGSWAVIKAANEAVGAKSIRVGYVHGKMTVPKKDGTTHEVLNVQYSNPIQKDSISSLISTAYVAPTEDAVTITFGASFTPEVGHRYVVRILRTDLTEHPGPMTYSYEHIAKTASVTDLIDALAAKIGRDARPGVTVSKTATTIVLTALEKDDNPSIPSLILYSQVTFEVAIFKTIPVGVLTNSPIELVGVEVAKTFGNPGAGNWKIVRDREDYALAYRGVDFRANGIFPYVAPELNVEKAATYGTVTVLYNNKYRSNDMQYIKSTPLCVEIYAKAAAQADLTMVADALAIFAGTKEPVTP